MFSLPPSPRPASYVRSLLEGTGVNRAVIFRFFLGMMLAGRLVVMAGTGRAVTKGPGGEAKQGFFWPPRQWKL